ncbi:MAG: hypothetical protein ACRDKT_09435 [Actinomycetota bacterium]
MIRARFGAVATVVVTIAGITFGAPTVVAADCDGTSVGLTPLTQLGDRYQSYRGGLYPKGRNRRPKEHNSAGLRRARRIGPLSSSGEPDANGRYVLLSIGMSNTTQEFEAFMQLTRGEAGLDPNLVIVDGAQGGHTAQAWADPNEDAWTTVEQRLQQAGVAPEQVVVAWVKLANPRPSQGFPQATQILQNDTETVIRNMKSRYRNLKLVYLSSRIYAGYATTDLNPEPYAYEGGFAMKWVIRNQIRGDDDLNFKPSEGEVVAPWLSWGPYLWADGLNERPDGLSWECADFLDDGTHPSPSGEQKVASRLLRFLRNDVTARQWFLESP